MRAEPCADVELELRLLWAEPASGLSACSSGLRRAASQVIAESLARECVEPSGGRVPLELPIPHGGVVLGEPFPKSGQIPLRKLLHGARDLLHCRHGKSLLLVAAVGTRGNRSGEPIRHREQVAPRVCLGSDTGQTPSSPPATPSSSLAPRLQGGLSPTKPGQKRHAESATPRPPRHRRFCNGPVAGSHSRAGFRARFLPARSASLVRPFDPSTGSGSPRATSRGDSPHGSLRANPGEPSEFDDV